MQTSIQIEVVSDTVCPWCFVGKRQLERALSRLPEVSAQVRWKPFLLDPSVPRAGVDADTYMLQKFGSARVVELMRERIGVVAEQVGIHFDLARQKKRPNTLDSHRLVHWAYAAGKQDAVVDLLFRGYFEQGKDIGDRDVLAALAEQAGMSADEVRAKLETDADEALIRSEIDSAYKREITAVPTFDFEGFRLPGAQSPEVIVSIIQRVIARRNQA